ncbi:MAG: hypothetical protein KGI06_04505 [Candidatus Micrarchaeota archaeon]|nr:hypothetical protein [Candidatus Micrarchaeota archaeon]
MSRYLRKVDVNKQIAIRLRRTELQHEKLERLIDDISNSGGTVNVKGERLSLFGVASDGRYNRYIGVLDALAQSRGSDDRVLAKVAHEIVNSKIPENGNRLRLRILWSISAHQNVSEETKEFVDREFDKVLASKHDSKEKKGRPGIFSMLGFLRG